MTANTLPYSLDIISEYLENFQPPEGPFRPTGEWEHRYVMWMALRGPAGKSWPAGALRIKRTKNNRTEGLSLDIDQITRFSGVREEHVRLYMSIMPGRFSTPRGWTGRSKIFGGSGTDAGISSITGEMLGNSINRRGNAEYMRSTSNSVSTNWSLFDAVQRMPFYSGPFAFDLLEDMEVLKLDQRIAYRKPIEVELGGKMVRLHSFEQTGRGILPCTYWLDDQHRLLFAVGGLRTFLWDPNASIPEDNI